MAKKKITNPTPKRPRVKKSTKAATRANPEGKKEAFLAELRESGNVRSSCEKAQVDRTTAYKWRDEDEDFGKAWQVALEDGCDLLEGEARRRAYDGVKKPVFQGGYLVGHVQEYSDTLMMFLLKAHNPDKFNPKVKTEVSGPGGGAVDIAVYRKEVAQALDDEGVDIFEDAHNE